MDAELLQDWVLAGNAAAMDWYALTHEQPLPSQSILERTIGYDLGGISPGFGVTPRGGLTGSQLVIAGLIVAGALWLVMRK